MGAPREARTEPARYGATLMLASMLPAVALAISTASAAEISARQIQQNRFEFILTDSTVLSETEAQTLIVNAAKTICMGLMPILGRYRYEGQETISGKEPSAEPAAYRYIQEVSCMPGATIQAPQRRPMLKTQEQSQRIQEDIKRRSEEYFGLIADDRIDDAYSLLSAADMSVDEATWKSNKRSFQATAGEPLQISILKVTVYDNPAEAPEPGIYVAADFSNVYTGVPIHCGYLMWFSSIGGSFLIKREETGHVTEEQLKIIPNAQLPEIKRKLRCVAP